MEGLEGKAEMTKSLSRAVSKQRLQQWRQRNAESGEITTPIMLVNVIHGEKSGLVLNISQDSPLEDVLKLLQIAAQQVEGTIKAREGN